MRLFILGLVLLVATAASAETAAPVSVAVWTRPPCEGGVAVQRGDADLGVIAKRVFGDRNKWGELLATNPGLNPNQLEVGQCLLTSPAPLSDRLLAIVLAMFVRTTMDLPAPEEPERSEIVPTFAPSYQSVLRQCVALTSTGVVADNVGADAELFCAERLATAWRLAMIEPQPTPS